MNTLTVNAIEPAFLDVRGACQFTSLSRRTLDYAKDSGELPFIRKGRKILFSVADLHEWMLRDRRDVLGTVQAITGRAGK